MRRFKQILLDEVDLQELSRLPAEEQDFDPSDFNLPPEVAKYLNKG